MHRSGTSATTGLLAHLGVYLGAPERFLPADVHNPEGYHELQDAVDLNDRLLDWCGSAWDLPPELGDPHLGQLQPPPDLVARLKSLVASMDAEAAAVGRPWAVKDPRLSVLWPFWLQAKPTARVVLCVRNPAAIAQSLEIRNGLSLRFGLKLSEQYFEHLLSIPKERIEAQVRYEELVSDPEKVARDLVRNLRLESDVDRTRMAISSVKAELARNRGRLESMPASIDSHSISRAYARMLAHGPAPVVEPVNPPTLGLAPTSSPTDVAFENEGHAATTPVEVSSLNGCAPRLILAGHSHLRAIAGRPIVSESSELVAGPRGDGMLFLVGPGPKRDMSYFDTLADLAIGADVGIIWNGNEHLALYFFEAETPFDFLSAHVRTMNPSAQMKSQAAIRHRFQQTSFDTLDVVLKRLATGGLNRIALIGTPPPKGDNEALRALLQTEEFFVNWAAQLGHSVETVPITDPYVRLKLWYLLQDMQAEKARARGLMFIPVPKEVQDADGFLKREFWQDVTHANRAYGNVMYETVLRAFNK
ncbi:hypothetical protein BST28_20585 [Mycolicibacter kumamotonensis]|uniref:Sulfotransferase family protein n=2 Tax=Mycolicibacter kumamotonensis TaxID=354243 RepID=A0A1X0DWB7_9MYCO|nr:hypothetical protein BST28_20585 [Mycolicibacter kumamotonensis]